MDNYIIRMILASFYELEHYIQRVHPEKLSEEKLGFPKALFDMEYFLKFKHEKSPHF